MEIAKIIEYPKATVAENIKKMKSKGEREISMVGLRNISRIEETIK